MHVNLQQTQLKDRIVQMIADIYLGINHLKRVIGMRGWDFFGDGHSVRGGAAGSGNNRTINLLFT
jgi:hypothetical protein